MKKIILMLSVLIAVIGVSLAVYASTYSVNLYYTSAATGSHQNTTFSLPSVAHYSIQETSHSGSCKGLIVYVNNVRIGNSNISCLALQDPGYPIDCEPITGRTTFTLGIVHGTGSASINAKITY